MQFAKQFKYLDAREIANAVIEAEESMMSLDLSSLSFDECLRFILNYHPFRHPAVTDKYDYETMVRAIYPELLRHADENDPLALYALGCIREDGSYGNSNIHCSYLKRAIALGSDEACIAYSERFYTDDPARARALLASVIDRNLPRAAEPAAAELLFHAHLELARRSDPIEAQKHQIYANWYANRLVRTGYYPAIFHLCRQHYRERTKAGSHLPDGTSYWVHARFLVLSHCLRRGAHRVTDEIGTMLMGGIGCTRDLQKAAEVYVDGMLAWRPKPAALANSLGLPDARYDSPARCNLEVAAARKVRAGDTRAYRELILIALLSGNRSRILAECERAISAGAEGMIAAAYRTASRLPRAALEKGATLRSPYAVL